MIFLLEITVLLLTRHGDVRRRPISFAALVVCHTFRLPCWLQLLAIAFGIADFKSFKFRWTILSIYLNLDLTQ